MGEGKASFFPNFISARSPLGLRRLMFANNARKGVQFAYYDIQFVRGRWYAWFNEDIERAGDEMLEVAANGDT